jgi:Lon protease-like protein
MADFAESLPSRFPVFPLRGALLLPGGNLPLNIFEPRYLQMVRDAMQTDQVIGMIQPREAEDREPPSLYQTGCVGRITRFSETDDGRYEIVLTGVCRFDVAEEIETDKLYRQVHGNFARWRKDLQPEPPAESLKGRLLVALKGFFARHKVPTDWEAIDGAPLSGLVTSLCMICPFEASEKQALLEAPDLTHQAKLLIALLQMESASESGINSGALH